MWPTGVCLLVIAAALVTAPSAAQQEQQREQLLAVDQPPAHVIFGLLVEPWLNSSSRQARRQPAPPPLPLDLAAERAAGRQALVSAAVLAAALDRAAPDVSERLLLTLSEYDAASGEEARRRTLNGSLTELAEQLHGPVIRVEALLIAQQTQLLSVSEAVKALRDSSDEHGAITQFVNSVTSMIGGRVSANEADIRELGDSLRQLNSTLVSREREEQPSPAPVPAAPAAAAEAEAPGRCCDDLEAKLEAAAADRERLADRLDVALARLQALEEQQALLLRSAVSGGVSGGGSGGWRPVGSTAEAPDLSAAGSERREALVLGRSSSPDGRSSSVTEEPDIITADSLVTADDRGGQVVLGRSIQVTDSAGVRARSELPPQRPVDSGRSLHRLLAGAGDQGRWKPIIPDATSAGERRGRILPASPSPGTAASGQQSASASAAGAPGGSDTAISKRIGGIEDPFVAEKTAKPAYAEDTADSIVAEATGSTSQLPIPEESGIAAVFTDVRLDDSVDSAETGSAVSVEQTAEESVEQGQVAGGDQRAEGSDFTPGIVARRGRRPPPYSGQCSLPRSPVYRGSSRMLGCQPVGVYATIDGMCEWCLFNCPIYCPPTHCRCQWARP